MSRITLIKPRIGHRGMERYVDAGRMEPLQMGVLAALAPEGVDVKFYDDRVDDIPFGERTDGVFLTVETFTAKRAYEIAAAYRERGVPVVIGGMHARLLPGECAEHADSVFSGDAENGFSGLVEDLLRGSLKPAYDAAAGFPGPSPVRRDIFRGKGYLPVSLLQRSRGCPNGCGFCATSAYFGSKRYVREDDEILEEIERDCRNLVFFVDDNFAADTEGVKIFLEKLIPRRRAWVSQLTVDSADDPELMELLERSGCIGGVIGFESLNPQDIERMGKKANAEGEAGYRRRIAAFKKRGFNIWAAFTLGHDGDDEASLGRTLSFAIDNSFAFAAFNILTPYPGTPLYDSLKTQGRLLFDGRWWDHPDYRFNDAVFEPARMGARELAAKCWEMRAAFNSLSNFPRRFFNLRLPIGHFLMTAAYANYYRIFRKEIAAKRELSLGGEGRKGREG